MKNLLLFTAVLSCAALHAVQEVTPLTGDEAIVQKLGMLAVSLTSSSEAVRGEAYTSLEECLRWNTSKPVIADAFMKHFPSLFDQFDKRVQRSLARWIGEIGKYNEQHTAVCVALLQEHQCREGVQALCTIAAGSCHDQGIDLPYLLNTLDHDNMKCSYSAAKAVGEWYAKRGMDDTQGASIIIQKIESLAGSTDIVDIVLSVSVTDYVMRSMDALLQREELPAVCEHGYQLWYALLSKISCTSIPVKRLAKINFDTGQTEVAKLACKAVVRLLGEDTSLEQRGYLLIFLSALGMGNSHEVALRAFEVFKDSLAHPDEKIQAIAATGVSNIAQFHEWEGSELPQCFIDLSKASLDNHTDFICFVLVNVSIIRGKNAVSADALQPLVIQLLHSPSPIMQLLGAANVMRAFSDDKEEGLKHLKMCLGERYAHLDQSTLGLFLEGLENQRSIGGILMGATAVYMQKVQSLIADVVGFEAD